MLRMRYQSSTSLSLLAILILVTSAYSQIIECSSGEFRCFANDECINVQHQCDAIKDCSDGSDEDPETCSTSSNSINTRLTSSNNGLSNLSNQKSKPSVSKLGCRIGLFTCLSGECINQSYVCDGRDDCRDGSDEASTICPNRVPSTTSTTSTTTSTEPPIDNIGDLTLIKLIPCDLPPQPKHGFWKIHASMCRSNKNCWPPQGLKSLQPGSRLVYGCDRGYMLNGSRDVFCGPEARWVKRPVCEEIKCPGLNSDSIGTLCVHNGQVISCQPPVPVNTVARITCREGYIEQNIYGAKNVTCGSDGKWSPEPLRCVPAPTICG